MQTVQRLYTLVDSRVTFFKEFLKHPRAVGSITPSSCFLEKRIVEASRICSANTVIELGAGLGGTTQAILNAMTPNARLLTIEINARFYNALTQIGDERLITHCGSASRLHDAMSRHHLQAPDVVVSGIPFSTLTQLEGQKIVTAISASLAPGGRFVAYQCRRHIDLLMRPLLGPAKMEWEFMNIPPMRVYLWQKPLA